MVEMSPVETLRAAAAKLRKRAADASDGPWETGGDGLVWPPRIGDPVSGSTEPEDAAWIALVHPGVAKPLAELLERAAESREAAESAVARVNGGSLIGDESPVTVEQIEERAAPAALRVARLLLGVPDGR